MSATNMRMHVNDNGQYKTMHPETNAGQVLLTSGGSLQSHLDSTVPVKIDDNTIKFLNPSTGEYENYSSDSLALIPLGKITNLTHSIINNSAVVNWVDPSDVTIDTNVKSVTVAKWKGTKLVMKQGSIPADEKDGTLLVDSTVKNQYSSTGFPLSNLVYGTTYYIKVFPYTESGVITNSNDSVITITPTQTKLGDVVSLESGTGGSKAYLRWKDPSNVVIGGVTAAVWAGTKVVMKEGSYPTSASDGTLVVDNKVRDQYSNTGSLGLTVSGLANNKTYFFGFFPYTVDGVETLSLVRASVDTAYYQLDPATGLSVSGVTLANNKGEATVKWSDPINFKKNILGDSVDVAIWDNSKLVRKVGSYPTSVTDGTLVVTNVTRDAYKTTGYYDADLPAGSTYYYTLFSITTDSIVRKTDVGSTFIVPLDDASGSPGPAILVAGNKTAGFYGEVTPTQLMSGPTLASQLGLTAGIAQYNNENWLKFSLDNKILFVAKKPYRHTISWDQISMVNAVNGSRIISIGGLNYKVRLLKGLYANNTTFGNTKGSEWNRLILPIHASAGTSYWTRPQYVESNISNWGINYNDNDLCTGTSSLGSRSWCQETVTEGENNARVLRGGVDAADSMWSFPSAEPYNGIAWRPVLELVQ